MATPRNDIHKILIIGSGPIVIGQACEFDYSGTQACKALRSLGYEVVLVNSNPATIMTDPEMADITYIEPLNAKRLEQIIAKERPDALLPNLGGQSGLNLCAELHNSGILQKYNVQIIGVQADAIQRGEDRIEFKNTMQSLGIETARSEVAYSVQEALNIADSLGYPVVLRPAYTMGGAGGGLVHNPDELKIICERGLQASLVHQVLVEESVLGWEELELEVVRDKDNNMITVCFIENVDPMGIHTGDSFCVAPMLTISEALQEKLQQQAYKIVEHIGVIGGTNVQFAHDPISDRVIVIEINPRTSRSSALASKATGFPIALVSAKLAAGLTLKDLQCSKYGSLDKYKPNGDFVVVKFARWAFEKFKGVHDVLGTQMRSVGEVMSIGKNFKEAFLKAIRSLEKNRYGLGIKKFQNLSKSELLKALEIPSSERYFLIYEALRKGASVQDIHDITHVKKFFIQEIKDILDLETLIISHKNNSLPDEIFIKAKKFGFSDKYLAQLLDIPENSIREKRYSLNLIPAYHSVHVAGTQNGKYFYSTYNDSQEKLTPDSSKKIMILGGGPNRIGQGIEFDYCCVHAAQALRKLNFKSIIINCNPETVSTDYDTSDTLYFEPLTLEDVLNIYKYENPNGVIAQFGGQTPLNLAADLEKNGVKIRGTSPEIIDLAEDRGRFKKVMDDLNIPMPESGTAANFEQALQIVQKIGFPVMVRPSYVLGGRGMQIVYDKETLRDYVNAAVDVSPEKPILIDRFLNHALECEADAICDGSFAFVPAVMEHIELAGIHSGDSACIIPSKNISQENLNTIRHYTRLIAEAMHVVGLMNIQFAIENNKIFVLEANPRASRTVPLVSKVCGIKMVPLAVQAMTTSDLPHLNSRNIPYYGVKESVFPFNMFPEVDPLLGPEMRSTGEVLGISENSGEAFFKAEEAAGAELPLEGVILFSLSDSDKSEGIELAKDYVKASFNIIATSGTFEALKNAGVNCEVLKTDIITLLNNKTIQMIVNTPREKALTETGNSLRRGAVKNKIPYVTTLSGARAALNGIIADKTSRSNQPKSIKEWHALIK